MPRKRTGEAQRSRITIDIGDTMARRIEAWAGQNNMTLKGFFHDAALRLLEPDFQCHVLEPDPGRAQGVPPELRGRHSPLQDYLRDATELWMTGVTLQTLWHERGLVEFLKSRIEAGVPMTFITFNPQVLDPARFAGDVARSVHEVWGDRYRRGYLGESLDEALKRAKDELYNLWRVGQRQEPPVLVQALGFPGVPLFGVTIANPHVSGRRSARVKLYLEANRLDPQPLLEFHDRTESGKAICEAMVTHVDRLKAQSAPLFPRDPAA